MNNTFEKLERWFEHWEPTLIGLSLTYELCLFASLCNSLHRYISQADFMNIPNIGQ